MTVVLLVDISSSGIFGTDTQTKRELIAEVAAVLSFSASINNDKVGALFFSSKVEKFIPPKKGRSHLLRIIRELIEIKPQNDGTDISEALRFLTNAIKRKCTAFLLSDLLDVGDNCSPNYEDALKVAVNRHDISVVNIYDPRERELPNIGLVKVKDAETGSERWVDTSSAKVRRSYAEWNRRAFDSARNIFNKYNIDAVSIGTNQDYVKGLLTLFNKRRAM